MNKELFEKDWVARNQKAADFYLFCALSRFATSNLWFTKTKDSFYIRPDNAKLLYSQLRNAKSIDEIAEIGFQFEELATTNLLDISTVCSLAFKDIMNDAFTFKSLIDKSIFFHGFDYSSISDSMAKQELSECIYTINAETMLYEIFETDKFCKVQTNTFSFREYSDYLAFAVAYARDDSFKYVSISDFFEKYKNTSDEFKDSVKTVTEKYVIGKNETEKEMAKLFWV